MNHDFYKLCYDQYYREMDQADAIYQRSGFMVAVISLIGAIIFSLSRIDELDQVFIRAEVFVYHLATFVALCGLVCSTVFLIVCVWPRHYATLDDMGAWRDWLTALSAHHRNSGPSENQSTQNPQQDIIDQVCQRMAEAQPRNAAINEARRRALGRSVKAVVISLSAVLVQAAFFFWIFTTQEL